MDSLDIDASAIDLFTMLHGLVGMVCNQQLTMSPNMFWVPEIQWQ